jgi:hypothetical protein
MQLRMRNAINCMYLELWYKFRWTEDWPFLLLHSNLKPESERLEIFKQFFDAPQCDLEPYMALKMRRFWGSPEDMARDEDLHMSLIDLAGRV